jgi:uncharacterized SAM-binding protein YcdF (DUF218 family)
MGELLSFVLSTEGVIAALVVGGAWILRRPHSSAARRFLLSATALYVIAGVYVVPAAVAALLSRGYHPFVPSDAVAARTAIVVLGGGADMIDGWNGGRTGVPGGDSAARVLEAARISRQLPDAVVISSGGVTTSQPNQVPVAIVMRDYLIELGVQPSRIQVESESRNTHDEAVVLGPMMRRQGIRQVVLVTSDVHMRRSVGTFAREGWDVIPAIAPDPNFDKPLRRRVVPTGNGLHFSNAVVHELFGIPYYWARGWWR